VARLGLRFVALGYLGLILLAPLGLVCYRTFAHDAGAAWATLRTHDTLHAFQVTLIAVGIAVPLNAIFGVLCALAIVRGRFRGRGLLNAFVDLPLALSPVVVGAALFLLYGRGGWLHAFDVLFTIRGIVLASVFISLPFVAREVVPTLREIGDEQEQAAFTLGASGWQTFWRVTLPSIRWAVVYGVVLTGARCLGEYGAVAVVSGNIEGRTQTATLAVQDAYLNLDHAGAYAISLVLALIAILVLVAMSVVRPREASR